MNSDNFYWIYTIRFSERMCPAGKTSPGQCLCCRNSIIPSPRHKQRVERRRSSFYSEVSMLRQISGKKSVGRWDEWRLWRWVYCKNFSNKNSFLRKKSFFVIFSIFFSICCRRLQNGRKSGWSDPSLSRAQNNYYLWVYLIDCLF